MKKETGTTRSGPDNGRWNGGKYWSSRDGYCYVWTPSHPASTAKGYVLAHRLVMELTLGRYLRKSEAVHHIDHDRSNNNPANLHVFPSNSAHRKFHNIEARYRMTFQTVRPKYMS